MDSSVRSFFDFLKLALTITTRQTPKAKRARQVGFIVYVGLTAFVVTQLLMRRHNPKELVTAILLLALVLVMGLLVFLGRQQLNALVWNILVSFVVIALICALGYGEFQLLRAQYQPVQPATNSSPAPEPKPKMVSTYCKEDPQTKLAYVYNAVPFLPQERMTRDARGQLVLRGGDSVNNGHEFTFSWTAPERALIYDVQCPFKGSSEGIDVCQPSDDHRTALLVGWINGQGGPTYMNVKYEMPCEIPVDTKLGAK